MLRFRANAAVVVAVLAAAGAFGCDESNEPRSLKHDVYVWQRWYSDAVVDAVRTRGPRFDGLRVLAAEVDGGDIVRTGPIGVRSAVAVIRVNGALDGRVLGAAVDDVVNAWSAAGIELRGIEVDHDCPTSKLADYAVALRNLRARVDDTDVPLSITALPSWSQSASLSDVIAAVDEVVLQVHAVDRPALGLFDKQRARSAVDAFAARSTKPFRVALPAYGHRLVLDEHSAVVAVESEEPRASALAGARVVDVWAEPADVQALLRELEEMRAPMLAGVVWFRLPVDGVRRGWSFATLEAVRAPAPVSPSVAVHIADTDVIVENTGAVDAALPAHIALDIEGLVAADGVAGCTFSDANGRASFTCASSSSARLAPGERRVVGWVRASRAKVISRGTP